MKPRLPLDTLRTLVNAPNGIDQLRMLVYELAFQGRLVEHGIEDARALADHLQTIGGHSYSRNRPQLTVASPFHHIPKHWCWVSMGLVGHDWGQRRPTSDFTYIDVSSIDNRKGIISGDVGVLPANRAPSRARKLVRHGSIIYSTVRPYLLNIAIVDKQFDPMPIASTAFAVLHPHEGIESRYVYHYLRCPAFVRYVESVQSGIAYPAISDRKFFAGSFPLPPLEEQKRIVAKVDELMCLCDRLEAQQQEREKLLPLLSRANHARFVTEPSHASLQSVFQNPGTVFADDLRQTVLSLAVRGSLVPQVASDGTADDLISEINDRKTKLLEANNIPTPSRLPLIDVRDVPFDLPKGWRWIRLESVCELITKGSSPKWQGVNYVTRPVDGVMFITSENVGNYNLRKMDEPKFVEAKFNEMEKRSILHRGDILINLVGASIGRSALWDRDDVANINQAVGIIRLVRGTKAINRRYLLHYLNSPTCLNIMFLNQVETARANISLTNVKEFLVPIPPEAEQQRIAATVDRVFNWISHLEEQQQARKIVSTKFAKAAVDAITSTEFTEIERMKPPKTEIVTALRIASKPQGANAAPLAALLSEQNGWTTAKSLWTYSGLEIDAFYRQLKTEMANGWIEEDTSKRDVREVEVG